MLLRETLLIAAVLTGQAAANSGCSNCIRTVPMGPRASEGSGDGIKTVPMGPKDADGSSESG